MANTIDNIIAFRVLLLLVTPFEKTEAFKRGVIDKDGVVLVKIKDQTPEQKDAYDMLDRLVFSLKRLLAKIPGGKSQIATLAAAYYLVKESYENKTPIKQESVDHIMKLIGEGITLAEEEITVVDFLKIYEEGMGAGAVGGGGAMPVNTIANRVGASVATDQPVIRTGPKKKKTPIARRPVPVDRRA